MITARRDERGASSKRERRPDQGGGGLQPQHMSISHGIMGKSGGSFGWPKCRILSAGDDTVGHPAACRKRLEGLARHVAQLKVRLAVVEEHRARYLSDYIDKKACVKKVRDLMMNRYVVTDKTMTGESDELKFLGRVIGRNPDVYYWEAGSKQQRILVGEWDDPREVDIGRAQV